MTNLKTFVSMLESAAIPYEVTIEGSLTQVTLEANRSSPVTGYVGFVTIFTFVNGALTQVGIWE